MAPDPARVSLSRWAAALADRLMPFRAEPGPLVLDCDATAIQDAGAELGVASDQAIAALALAVRDGGGLEGAATAARSFVERRRPRPAPEHLGALALLVLAATQMGEPDGLHRSAYYQRLERLLGPPDRRATPPYRGFAELCTVGFPALADWMAQDIAGARGDLLLPAHPQPHWIGWPVSQVALRAADRRRLTAFCAERSAELRAGWDPAGVLLNHPVHARLTRSAREMLADPQHRLLVSDALRRLAGWVRPAATPRRGAVSRLRGQLMARLDLRRRHLRLALGVEELAHRQAGYGPERERVIVPAAPSMLPVPLSWCAGAERRPVNIALDDGRLLEVLPAGLILFESGPLGLSQVRRAGEGALWALTCHPEIRGEEICVDLPPGWRLLCAVDPATLPRRGGGPRSAVLRLVGGLPLDRRTWLASAPPAVVGPAALDCELLIDGRPAGRMCAGVPVPLTTLAGREGTFMLQAETLSRSLLLVARGMRRGYGSVSWRLDSPARAAAGAGDRPASGIAPVLIGGDLIGDAEALSSQAVAASTGPWSRLQGTVWVLMVDGRCELVRSPLPEAWHRGVGYGPGDRWRLPAGAVWACQPQRQLVQHAADSATIEGSLTGEAVAVIARCAQARVLGGPAAEARWQEAVLDAGVVQHG